MSRPIEFDPAIVWPIIFEKIVEGKSLSAIIREWPDGPSYTWCKESLRSDPALRKRYDEATQDRADVLAEEVERIADEPIPEGLDGPSMSAWIQRQRLRFDARRWASSKLAPRRYGDRITVEQTGTIVNLQALVDERQRRMREMLRRDAIEGECTVEK
jgi:hypothetical protein